MSNADDHGNSIASATKVVFPSGSAGVINSGNDLDFFRFTLISQTAITIKPTGNIDTYVTLYNSSGSRIAVADDASRFDRNFSMSCRLAAGTYTVAVKGYDSSVAGGCTLVVQCHHSTHTMRTRNAIFLTVLVAGLSLAAIKLGWMLASNQFASIFLPPPLAPKSSSPTRGELSAVLPLAQMKPAPSSGSANSGVRHAS